MAALCGLLVADHRSEPWSPPLELISESVSDVPIGAVIFRLVGKPISHIRECNNIAARIAGLDTDSHPILAGSVMMLAFDLRGCRHALAHFDGLGKLSFNESHVPAVCAQSAPLARDDRS